MRSLAVCGDYILEGLPANGAFSVRIVEPSMRSLSNNVYYSPIRVVELGRVCLTTTYSIIYVHTYAAHKLYYYQMLVNHGTSTLYYQ